LRSPLHPPRHSGRPLVFLKTRPDPKRRPSGRSALNRSNSDVPLLTGGTPDILHAKKQNSPGPSFPPYPGQSVRNGRPRVVATEKCRPAAAEPFRSGNARLELKGAAHPELVCFRGFYRILLRQCDSVYWVAGQRRPHHTPDCLPPMEIAVVHGEGTTGRNSQEKALRHSVFHQPLLSPRWFPADCQNKNRRHPASGWQSHASCIETMIHGKTSFLPATRARTRGFYHNARPSLGNQPPVLTSFLIRPSLRSTSPSPNPFFCLHASSTLDDAAGVASTNPPAPPLFPHLIPTPRVRLPSLGFLLFQALIPTPQIHKHEIIATRSRFDLERPTIVIDSWRVR